MGEEPSNASTELGTELASRLSDRDFFMGEYRNLLAPDFVRIDRRRLIAQPPAGAEEYIESHLALEELGGTWPTYSLTEIIAVRGDRLAVSRVVISVGTLGELEQVAITQTNATIDRLERLLLFDSDDLDDALAELDRLHAEIENSGRS